MRQRDAATLLEHSDVNDQIKKQVSDFTLALLELRQ
jgi:hypothetical protein